MKLFPSQSEDEAPWCLLKDPVSLWLYYLLPPSRRVAIYIYRRADLCLQKVSYHIGSRLLSLSTIVYRSSFGCLSARRSFRFMSRFRSLTRCWTFERHGRKLNCTGGALSLPARPNLNRRLCANWFRHRLLSHRTRRRTRLRHGHGFRHR